MSTDVALEILYDHNVTIRTERKFMYLDHNHVTGKVKFLCFFFLKFYRIELIHIWTMLILERLKCSVAMHACKSSCAYLSIIITLL